MELLILPIIKKSLVLINGEILKHKRYIFCVDEFKKAIEIQIEASDLQEELIKMK